MRPTKPRFSFLRFASFRGNVFPGCLSDQLDWSERLRSLRSGRGVATILSMPHSRSSRRLISGSATVLLLAAVALLAPRIAFAVPFLDGKNTSAATAAEACCDIGRGADCAGSRIYVIDNTCPRLCAQPNFQKQPQVGSHVPTPLAFASPSCTGRAVFPTQTPRLSLAPPAGSSTLLIYHLQRLLI